MSARANATTAKPRSEVQNKEYPRGARDDCGGCPRIFDPVLQIARKLQTLLDVGLSYIKLGQSATTLSGGEAQRVKLSRAFKNGIQARHSTFLMSRQPACTSDIKQLLAVLHRLRDHGNTIVVIEHNLDVIKTGDWIVDLGPEGGDEGGKIIAEGTPEQVAKNAAPTPASS